MSEGGLLTAPSRTADVGIRLQLPPRYTLMFFALLAALYAAILVAKFSLWQANALQADWTYYNNIFWNTNFRDLWLFSYDRFHVHGYRTYLNEHFAPLLIPMAAFYQVFPWREAFLLALHGASPILTAIGIRAIGLRLLDDRWLATMIGLVFAFNPGILWPTISLVYGFEPDSLLPPCAALLAYGLVTRRNGLYFAGLLLGCGIKENVPAYGVILGLCLIFFAGRRRLGVWTAVISLAIFFVASKGVPYLTGVQNQNVEIVWHFLDNLIHLRPTMDYTLPEIAFAAVYCSFFLPALLVWPYLAMIGPDILAIGQVAWATTGTWHVMLPVAVLGIASVFGTQRFLAGAPSGVMVGLDRRWVATFYWRLALALSLIAGPATLWLAYSRYIAQAVPIDRAALAEAVKLVPPQAGIITSNDLDQYFAHRKIVTTRPILLRKTSSDFSYIAVNRNAVLAARHQGKARESLDNDICLIEIAETAAKTKGAVVLDRGRLLVVKLSGQPIVDCK